MPFPSRIRRGCPEGDKTSLEKGAPRPIAFFDRDGVLNEDKGYVHTLEAFNWLDGALSSLTRFKEEGWWVVVVTNQSGIARGFYKEEDVLLLSETMLEQTPIDLILYCPHMENCPARKPGTGMLEAAFEILPGTRDKSFLVGDKGTDIMAAEAAGVRAFLFDKSMGNLDEFLAESLSEG
jgi:D-glycero-D-manno-heptose 1,7-bisphosphate phosphatase